VTSLVISHKTIEFISISETVFVINPDDGGRYSLQNVGNCTSTTHTPNHLRRLHSFSCSRSFKHKRALSDIKLWQFLPKMKKSTKAQNIFYSDEGN
jgi:hypothetical protein